MEARKEARWIEVKAMEERKAAFKERKVAIEEEKLRIMGNKVVNKNLEREQKIMFMDTSCLDQQKAYVSTMRARILAAQMGGFEGGTSNGSNGLWWIAPWKDGCFTFDNYFTVDTSICMNL